ncbi:ornithine decarboxylase [Siccirubricoccus deserti]|uniref:ornithine decarboxylase n=1 Tax=Siccirubricoccus deserti TaxID=2013562 RepID=A0A9X0QYS4_9PROT|nr:type III PLP-dependent enzyme [Siccirubricoccus deserti]MBC4016095.1 type III PLP-dependent enzyme [Siccirubricoccus deserti]GGC46137.1 ornithine decarboxylase [Siccirubricoccus deserti]
MSLLRARTAVSPLRRFDAESVPHASCATPALPRIDDLIAVERPEEPMHALRPAVIAAASASFEQGFPGKTLYAVKCNPEPAVLRAVWAGGVRHFDCASAGEVALVRSMFPAAHIHFMHPVKARGAIRAAWAQHGVRDFVLDTAEELGKILAETGADDRGLVVRLALPKGRAVYDLSGKFGAVPEDAVALLRAARPHAARLGVSFHVGSQCLDPLAWREALALAGRVIRAAGVAIDIVDVGGGFPVAYADTTPLPLGAFFAEIEAGFEALALPGAVLWAEPGRALVAAGGSVIIQVQQRRGDALYVNDGIYGALSDAGRPGFAFPVRLIRPEGAAAEALHGFSLFGPTCDSADHMAGPFLLPEDVREGDWIELGQLGAYGGCLRTAFNGFDRAKLVEVRDAPQLAGA